MKLNIEKLKNELVRIEKNEAWLATELGVTRQAVNLYFVRGIKKLDAIDRIAKALNIDPRDLIIND